MEISNTGIDLKTMHEHELRVENNEMIMQYKKDVANRAEHVRQTYLLTVYRDDEPMPRSIYLYPNAIEAADGYLRYNDWGFAKSHLVVSLYEPNDLVHTKILRRPRGGECTFVRNDYLEAKDIFIRVKDDMDKDLYNDLVLSFAKIFSKDNQRFDEQRFFNDCGIDQ